MKKRLDVAIFENGLCESREKAKALIMAGLVYVNGQKADKAGTGVGTEDKLEVRGNHCPYVSRGGLKLEKALSVFSIDPREKNAIDVGASSGGFTDCLLQNGAKHVYAVDVGYGQLAYSLRCDERVSVFEKTNFRNMPLEAIPQPLDLAVMDVSFISITKLAEHLKEFLKPDAHMMFLIKPQFEADRAMVGKKGVISDEKAHVSIVEKTLMTLLEKGYYIKELDFSPVKGPKGNIEFLSHYTFAPDDLAGDISSLVRETVRRAHEELK